jgi:hypothetical protein
VVPTVEKSDVSPGKFLFSSVLLMISINWYDDDNDDVRESKRNALPSKATAASGSQQWTGQHPPVAGRRQKVIMSQKSRDFGG